MMSSAPLRVYLDLELLAFQADAAGDEEKSNLIRNLMDVVWPKISDAERGRLSQRTGDVSDYVGRDLCEDPIETALASLLDQRKPPSLRGAAIGCLLTQAAQHRRVELAGVSQDLTEILPTILALALRETPESLLAARREETLHPTRFGLEGLRIEEVSLIGGLWSHYGCQEKRLVPTPLPLVQELRRLAGRTLRTGEHQAEENLIAGLPNWTAPHIAPPWMARWFLTEWHLSWLCGVDDAVIEECLKAVSTGSRFFEWLAYAWRSEGDDLSEAQRSRSLDAWRVFQCRQDASPQAVASMATGILRELEEPDRRDAIAQIMRSSALWRPYLWDSWIKGASAHKSLDLVRCGFEGLSALIEDDAENPQARLNAALFLLRHAATLRSEELGAQALENLGRISSHPPFNNHRGLLRELQRLGVSGTS